MAPIRIWNRNKASTTQKYFAVARMDGVTRKVANGSASGSFCSSAWRSWVTA
jgi:hypothetical protein